MKLKAIKRIKQYKSFQDFNWQSFFGGDEFHDDINIIFGENGSGKTCICNILKNVLKSKGIFSIGKNFGYKSFKNHKPKEASLKFDIGEFNFSYKSPIEQNFEVKKDHIEKEFADNFWDLKLNRSDAILFFDREFVGKHIHLGHDRGTKKGQHEQESGDMIIQFDGKAINLRSERENAKSKKNKQEQVFQKFNTDNSAILDFTLSEKEIKLFQKYKGKSKEVIKEIKAELTKRKKSIEKKLETDESSQKIVNDIQDSIEEIGIEEISISLSNYKEYHCIFNFDLKEQIKIEAEKTLIEKLQLHKDFFETGFKMRKIHIDRCPFCQSKNEEENIAKIIKTYNQIFDNTYKKQSQQFENDKQILIDELETIKQKIVNFDSSSIFINLSELNQKYKFKNIYSANEQRIYKKPQIKKLNELIIKISKLKKPNKENIKALYDEVKKEFETLAKFFKNIAKLVSEKNKIIKKFKSDNTDEILQKRIMENSEKLVDIDQQLAFFNEVKIDNQKKRYLKEKELKTEQIKYNDVKKKYTNAKKKYEDYCSKEVFKKPLEKIEEYFKNFNFSFKLKLKTEKVGNKTEFPFAFKVLDSEGSERDLKEGLSEGELQVLSLCFFFAFLDIQKEKKNKILIFDDPITSLDNSNLSCLVDLIVKEQEKFSQTFVLTHHRTFFKFLRKSFKIEKEKGREYLIVRNKKALGGSFLCKSNLNEIRLKLRNFEKNLIKLAQNEGFSEEEIIIEYGQYLRYEIESHIKNNLLHLNKPNLGNIIDSLISDNQTIDKSVLKRLKDIYSFCNWTTSHVGESDDENGLEQLKNKIADFIAITKKGRRK